TPPTEMAASVPLGAFAVPSFFASAICASAKFSRATGCVDSKHRTFSGVRRNSVKQPRAARGARTRVARTAEALQSPKRDLWFRGALWHRLRIRSTLQPRRKRAGQLWIHRLKALDLLRNLESRRGPSRAKGADCSVAFGALGSAPWFEQLKTLPSPISIPKLLR